jgi:hypothetical protein
VIVRAYLAVDEGNDPSAATIFTTADPELISKLIRASKHHSLITRCLAEVGQARVVSRGRRQGFSFPLLACSAIKEIF